MDRYARPRAYGGILLAVLLLAALHTAGWLGPLFDPLTTLVHRLSGPAYSAGSAIRDGVEDLSAEEEIDVPTLQAVLDGLRVENARLRTLADENAGLREALGYLTDSEDTFITARVVSEVSEDAHNALIIDRGAADGLAVGQPVIVGEGILIGKISSVTRRTASVVMLTDSKSAVAVMVQNGDATLGVLEGDRGLSMAITLIPQSERIVPGDIVVTSGIEPGIRKGLVVGTIDKVFRDTQDPFQSATVAALASARHPSFIHALIPPEREDGPSLSAL